MKDNVRNISKKLEKEKTGNMWLNSANSRTTSLWTCNLLKSIEHFYPLYDSCKYYEYYDDFYDYYNDFYEYYDDFF